MNGTELIKRHFHGLLYSYSQIFFARSQWFGALLLIASFINPFIGLTGLLAVIIINIIAESFTMNPAVIEDGLYGYCGALVGMGMGAYFQLSLVFFILLIIVSAFCLIFTIGLQGFLAKYYLPYMGFPFLFTFWLLLLAAKYFTFFEHIGIHSYSYFQDYFLYVSNFNKIGLPDIIIIFCRSLGSVFFQNNFLVGAVIAIGLFLYSRISFLLAVIGFTAAFYFYRITGIDTNDLIQNFVGANYIFIAIALGGFFIIPNLWSYLLVVAIIPMVALIHYGSNAMLDVFHLPAYTLALSFTTLCFLYLLKWRTDGKYIHAVTVQNYSPEKNIYHYLITKENYRFAKYYPVSLPFWGEWTVSQGHDGKITHLGDWSKAFDFIITDEEKKSYQLSGNRLEDYYCYNKPILAPGDGFIEKVIDSIDDNVIADVNTKQNWGNSILIHHGNGLYSQLSHLKKESFKVKLGDYVKRGDALALAGNSGRSQEPHVHFQMQTTSEVGAKTFDYPVASYVSRTNTSFKLKIFSLPKQGEIIRNPEINAVLKNAFNFSPGRKFKWEWNGHTEHWDVFTDEWNRINIHCKETKSVARIENDGVIFRFIHFEGNRNTFLYQFYLCCYKVFLGFYHDLLIEENYPVIFKTNFLVQWIEDLTSPFFHLVKSDFKLKYIFADDLQYSTRIELNSISTHTIGIITLNKSEYKIFIGQHGFDRIEIIEGNKKTVSVCEV